MPIYIGHDASPLYFAGPASSEEIKVFRSLYRSQVAPQGIGVVNAGGQALAWAMNHEDNEDILTSIGYTKEQIADLTQRQVI